MNATVRETEPGSRTLMNAAKGLYLVALLAWTSYVILYPPWIGRIYQRYGSEPWHSGGTFEVQGGEPALWNPPHHSGVWTDGAKESVRWPWQPISRQYHVEVRVTYVLFQVLLAWCVLGLTLGCFYWTNPLRVPDGFVLMAWSMSLSLMVAMLTVVVLFVFSACLVPDETINSVLGCGVAGGICYGAITCALPRFPWLRLPWRKKSLQASDEDASATGRSRRYRTEVPVFWFVLGLATAIPITFFAAWIATFFRGPVIGRWELGTPRYAHDQSLIELITGLGIGATGWFGNRVLLRRQILRAYAIGVRIGAILMGLLFALR